MKLRKPPSPDPIGTAAYYWVHAGHRQTAIDTAIEVIRQAAEKEIATGPDDVLANELTGIMRGWAIESLIQGAWIREYHMWERNTKDYFDGQHVRNGGTKVKWKKTGGGSHVSKVKDQLVLFSASIPAEVIDAIDQARKRVNVAKHEDEDLATEGDYGALATAVASFWEALTSQEEFTPAKINR
jgi:hypothetical protein